MVATCKPGGVLIEAQHVLILYYTFFRNVKTFLFLSQPVNGIVVTTGGD